MITVITPTLNAAKTVVRCADSKKAQCSVFRHLFVDGGSTDTTIQLLQANSCELVLAPGSGIYSAMNTGISASDTEWLYFMGADDSLLPGAVDAILPELEKTDRLICRVPISIEGRVARHSNRQQGIIYRREVFAKFGVFDETDGLYADRAYYRRLGDIETYRLDIPMTWVSLDGVTGPRSRRI